VQQSNNPYSLEVIYTKSGVAKSTTFRVLHLVYTRKMAQEMHSQEGSQLDEAQLGESSDVVEAIYGHFPDPETAASMDH
jgi:hypothetical protein